ncbi:hypothetical protein T492DRAFT_849460 [Pavlovales sp. CCMP2436]|nr:hypothetical protein T492DRAFT_849460 [Pavlovales sp. CCMP2436]
MLREERHNFGVPVLEHRKDLTAQCDKLFCHQKEMARAVDDERTALHALKRLAKYARALDKERATLGKYRSRLQDVSASCAACSRAISLLHKEMALNRENAKREAAELASRSGQLEESARHPRRTA